MKKDGDIIKNPMRPMVMGPDALPFPSYANDSYYFLDDDSVTRQEPLLASVKFGFKPPGVARIAALFVSSPWSTNCTRVLGLQYGVGQ